MVTTGVEERLGRLRAAMRERSVDLLALAPSDSLRYALGFSGRRNRVRRQQRRLDEISELVGARGDDAVEKLRHLLDRQKKLEREVESFKAKAAVGAISALAESAMDLGGVKLIAARVEGLDGKALRDAVDMLKDKLGDAVILLASAEDGKASLVAGVKGTALGKVKAGELLAHVAGQIGGKGGGRSDMAQGGGQDGPALVAALAGVRDWVVQRLN